MMHYFNTPGLCKFALYEVENAVRMYELIYGKNEYMKDVGWREECISRAYAIATGMVPERNDTIPQRWWEPKPDGSAKGNAAFIDESDFLEARGVLPAPWLGCGGKAAQRDPEDAGSGRAF